MRPAFPAFVSDPQVQWDHPGGRWFYLAVAFTIDFTTLQVAGADFLMFGFSKSSDPTDLANGWCHYSLASGSTPDGTPLLDDYPKLGHDDRHLILGANTFAVGGSEPFLTARVWSLPKPPPGPLTSCPPAPVAAIFGSPAQRCRVGIGDRHRHLASPDGGDGCPVPPCRHGPRRHGRNDPAGSQQRA